jgi:hypothetical protein
VKWKDCEIINNILVRVDNQSINEFDENTIICFLAQDNRICDSVKICF